MLKTTSNKLHNFIKNKPLECVFICVTLILLTVLTMQFFFSILPCKMCYLQRYPYYLIFLLSLTYIFMQKRIKIFLIFICLSFITTAGIATYHVAIERKLVSITPNCAGSDNSFVNSSDLLNHLTGLKAVSCDVPAFKLFFTLSEWNLLVAILLFFYTLHAYLRVTNKLD